MGPDSKEVKPMYAPIPDYITDLFLDRRCRQIRQREQAHYEVNEWDEPAWYEMPDSVYAAYEDAVQAERY